jgi:hypothetical protein
MPVFTKREKKKTYDIVKTKNLLTIKGPAKQILSNSGNWI